MLRLHEGCARTVSPAVYRLPPRTASAGLNAHGLRMRRTQAYNAGMFLLLHGPDDFTAHETLARLRESHDFGYSVDTFAGAEADLSAILASCDTVPFLSAERL